MSRTLILLRHGKSDWSTGDNDFDRPLKKRGRHASALVGKWLMSNDRVPDFIVSSPAKRAMQTAEIACEATGSRNIKIFKQKHIYLATPEELLYVLEDCPSEASRVMLVGHNPGLTSFANYLVPGLTNNLPTAGMVCVRFEQNDWDLYEKPEIELVLHDFPKNVA